MYLLRCTPKQFAWLLIFISVSGVLHVWYMNRYMMYFISDVANLVIHSKTADEYILFWNYNSTLKDQYQNVRCYIDKTDKSYGFKVRSNPLESEENIHAIIFTEKNLDSMDRPTNRRVDQYYIFWSMEVSDNAPACKDYNNNFFNWTFTYRLDSTVIWYYFIVEDTRTGTIVAPDNSVTWDEVEYGNVKPEVKNIISEKKKALVYILSDNKTNQRDNYISGLQEHMSFIGLSFDLIDSKIQKSINENLDEIIKKDYYFYIAFEDIFADDYVTDKVLRAYKNYAVPVVYGGANYSRFLPPGSYLNAGDMHPYSLARAIKKAIANPKQYESYFYWRNVYKIIAYEEGNFMHKMCGTLISATFYNGKKSAIKNFTKWWNSPKAVKTCDERKLQNKIEN